MRNTSAPDMRARLMMLSSSGPANIPGNNVRTSICMAVPAVRNTPSWSAKPSAFRPLFHNFDRTAQSLFCAAYLQQRPYGLTRRTLLADDLPHVHRMQAQFIDG